MMTFSIASAAMDGARSLRGIPYFTLYSVAPALDRPAQLEVRHDAGDERQPEREGAEDEDGDDGEAGVDVERGEGADHAALHPADAAGHRQQVAEHADEERLHEDGPRRRGPERAERGPQDEDLEAPEGDSAEQCRVARAHVGDR